MSSPELGVGFLRMTLEGDEERRRSAKNKFGPQLLFLNQTERLFFSVAGDYDCLSCVIPLKYACVKLECKKLNTRGRRSRFVEVLLFICVAHEVLVHFSLFTSY